MSKTCFESFWESFKGIFDDKTDYYEAKIFNLETANNSLQNELTLVNERISTMQKWYENNERIAEKAIVIENRKLLELNAKLTSRVIELEEMNRKLCKVLEYNPIANDNKENV